MTKKKFVNNKIVSRIDEANAKAVNTSIMLVDEQLQQLEQRKEILKARRRILLGKKFGE